MLNELQQWYPRKAKHPWYNKQPYIIDIFPAIFQAKCIVLLPIYKHEFTKETQKILTGMISVLNLSNNEYSIAKIYINETIEVDWGKIYTEISMWQPQYILFLEKNNYIKNDNIINTYNPMDLQNNKILKHEAYNDLLILQQKLHGG